LLDSRRLTGANLYCDLPGAIIDVQFDDADAQVLVHWQQAAFELLEACGLGDQKTYQRRHANGASLLINAPIDGLYAMCELNEVAWSMALFRHGLGSAPDLPAQTQRLVGLFAAERRPRLLQLQQQAHARGVPFLWDDDEVSVGFGASCQLWPYEDIPDPQAVDWPSVRSIPVALVTGTNGKSTTVRMTAAIMKAAGLRGGLTSTDFIRVGDVTVEEGDYSGTGGARTLLRHPDVEAAVLEVARGGLLRRGLAVERADAALITNVAADHLGEYGINTVAELMEAKFIVHRALDEHAPLVLNADDPGLLAYESELRSRKAGTTWWFSLHKDHPKILESLEKGQGACWLADDDVYTNINPQTGDPDIRKLLRVNEITASRGGLLGHNIQNALGASMVSLAMGLPGAAIAKGLADFRGDEKDNPGRGNWFEAAGIHIIVDFAHNEHGVGALADSVLALGQKRVSLMIGQAGDRTDEAIAGMTQSALRMQPDRLLVYELPGYERGRPLDEPTREIRRVALESGMAESQLVLMPNPLAAASAMLNDARAGDVLVLLALTNRREILQRVNEFVRQKA
jgi:UDP-N-acetylmuramyl tripeptide synthase